MNESEQTYLRNFEERGNSAATATSASSGIHVTVDPALISTSPPSLANMPGISMLHYS